MKKLHLKPLVVRCNSKAKIAYTHTHTQTDRGLNKHGPDCTLLWLNNKHQNIRFCVCAGVHERHVSVCQNTQL